MKLLVKILQIFTEYLIPKHSPAGYKLSVLFCTRLVIYMYFDLSSLLFVMKWPLVTQANLKSNIYIVLEKKDMKWHLVT